jgi:hypothetical protein
VKRFFHGSTRRPAWLAVLGSLAWGCCGGSLSGAVANHGEGRYPQARAELVSLEPQVPCLSGTEQIRYALYRGLSELALGNAVRAHHWLSKVRQSLEQDPEALAPVERGQFDSAWRSLGLLPNERR